MAASFEWAHRVEWGETDAAAIVFYPNYFRWFDRSTHELFRTAGYPIARMLQEGVILPIIESGAQFTRPVQYGDEVVIRSTVAEIRTRAIRIEHRVTRDAEAVCTGFEVRMWVRAGGDEMQPGPIPAVVRELLAEE